MNTVCERSDASQMKQGNSTEQYRPIPSSAPEDSGSHRFSSMNKPYAAPKRRHTNGIASANRIPVTPYSVS